MTVQAQRTTGRKEHLSAAEYNARRAAIENGAVNKAPLVHHKLTDASRKAKTPVQAEQEYNKNNLPNLGFVETNASYEIGGVQYLPSEVFDRKHSVYDAIATGVGRTSARRDVFDSAKTYSRLAVIRAINNCIQNYARYPSFQEECRTCMNAVNCPSINSVYDLKDVMVGNALRNEIQIEVMHATCLEYKVQVTNVKL